MHVQLAEAAVQAAVTTRPRDGAELLAALRNASQTLNLTAALPQEWRGREKVLRVRGPPRDGFWVRAVVAISQGLWASLHGLQFFVEQRWPSDAYFDPRRPEGSGWESYFEPIDGVPVRRLLGGGVGGASGRLDESRVLEMACDAAKHVYFARSMLYPSDMGAARAMRMLGAAAADAWVRVRPDVTAAADAEWQIVLGDGRRRQRHEHIIPRVLGVHMRGTDKMLRPIVEPARYFPLIDAWLAQLRGEEGHIFLATDDAGFAAQVVARYGTARVRQQAAVERAAVTNSTATGMGPLWSGSSGDAGYRRGVEVLVDTLLLSRCEFLLKSASAVSEFAIYLNPRLAEASYDFNIDDQPPPQWWPGGEGAPRLPSHMSSTAARADRRGLRLKPLPVR